MNTRSGPHRLPPRHASPLPIQLGTVPPTPPRCGHHSARRLTHCKNFELGDSDSERQKTPINKGFLVDPDNVARGAAGVGIPDCRAFREICAKEQK